MYSSSESVLFKNWQWGEALVYLSNVLHRNENIILVSGQSNSGKTTLKQEIINNLDRNSKIFSTFAEHKTTVATFMQQVHFGFDVVWDHNLPPDWEELQRTVVNKADHHWLLLIDDAEKLSWDILNSLIDLYINLSSSPNNFHLILFAKDCFLDNIKNSSLRDFFEIKFETIYLKPLSLEEMTVFVRNIMHLNFDRNTLKKIYRASNGIIGKVKQLAIAEHNIHNTEKNLKLSILLESIINPPFIRLIACGCLLFIAYVVFTFTQKQYNTVEFVTKVNKANFNMRQEPNSFKLKNVDSTKLEPDTIQPVSASLQKNLTSEQDLLSHASVVESSDINNSYDNHENNNHITTELNFNKLENYINQSQHLHYEKLYQKLYLDLKNNLQLKLLNLEKQINQLQEYQQNIQQNKKSNSLLENHSYNALNNYNKIIKNHALKLNNNQQLLNSPKNFFVLQLMASKNEQSIIKLINNYPKLFSKIRYCSGKFKPVDDVWYIAIYGNYNDPRSAIQDLKNLPPELRKLKPLVRDYNSLKKLINNSKSDKTF